MTGSELALELKRKLNRLDTASNRSLRQETALRFLTDAYVMLTRAKYKAGSTRDDDSTFQYTQLTTDELNHLTAVKDDFTIDSVSGFGYEVSVSDIEDYWIHLMSQVTVKSGTSIAMRPSPTILSLDEMGPALEDPFNKPTFEEPAIVYEAGKIRFPATNFEVTKYRITYIKRPKPIKWDTEYEIPYSDQITDIAAILILEGWESARTQTKTMVDKLVENS